MSRPLVSITFACPVPPRANARGHSLAHASLVKKQRAATSNALLLWNYYRAEVCTKNSWLVRITRMSKHPVDDGDGISSAIKAFRDEVASWLGLTSDRDRRVKFVGKQEPSPHPELPRYEAVRIEIFAREQCANCGAPTINNVWVGDGTSAEPRQQKKKHAKKEAAESTTAAKTKNGAMPNMSPKPDSSRARSAKRHMRRMRQHGKLGTTYDYRRSVE